MLVGGEVGDGGCRCGEGEWRAEGKWRRHTQVEINNDITMTKQNKQYNSGKNIKNILIL